MTARCAYAAGNEVTETLPSCADPTGTSRRVEHMGRFLTGTAGFWATSCSPHTRGKEQNWNPSQRGE